MVTLALVAAATIVPISDRPADAGDTQVTFGPNSGSDHDSSAAVIFLIFILLLGACGIAAVVIVTRQQQAASATAFAAGNPAAAAPPAATGSSVPQPAPAPIPIGSWVHVDEPAPPLDNTRNQVGQLQAGTWYQLVKSEAGWAEVEGGGLRGWADPTVLRLRDLAGGF